MKFHHLLRIARRLKKGGVSKHIRRLYLLAVLEGAILERKGR